MRRTFIVLLIILLTKIFAFSETTSSSIKQDSILISTDELKYTNLIFVEHKKLLNENKLLNQQVNNLTILNDNLEKVDSIRLDQIEYINQDYNKKLKKKNNTILGWQIGGITISVGLLLFLLLK